MKFDIIVGNPPYGVPQKGSSPKLHLKIMNSVLKFCTNKLVFIMPSKPIVVQLQEPWFSIFKNAVCNKIEVVGKDVFKGTDMDNTAIYYCDRNDDPKNYCKKLDVDKVIYNMIDSDAHRLFLKMFDEIEQMYITIPYGSKENKDKEIENVYIKTKEDKFYLNVNRAGGFGAKWLSGTLEKVDILTKDDEIEFSKKHTKKKNIIECPTKEYGYNLKNLMVNGLVLRYALWLTQINQNIANPQFKYVPDLDYTNIHTDEELLSVCGFTPEEIEKMMDYLKHFDFSKNRNDVVRRNINNNKKILI